MESGEEWRKREKYNSVKRSPKRRKGGFQENFISAEQTKYPDDEKGEH